MCIDWPIHNNKKLVQYRKINNMVNNIFQDARIIKYFPGLEIIITTPETFYPRRLTNQPLTGNIRWKSDITDLSDKKQRDAQIMSRNKHSILYKDCVILLIEFDHLVLNDLLSKPL